MPFGQAWFFYICVSQSIYDPAYPRYRFLTGISCFRQNKRRLSPATYAGLPFLFFRPVCWGIPLFSAVRMVLTYGSRRNLPIFSNNPAMSGSADCVAPQEVCRSKIPTSPAVLRQRFGPMSTPHGRNRLRWAQQGIAAAPMP